MRSQTPRNGLRRRDGGWKYDGRRQLDGLTMEEGEEAAGDEGEGEGREGKMRGR